MFTLSPAPTTPQSTFPIASTADTVVTSVIDGDTIEVRTRGITDKIRYIGIDTPESDDWLYEEATKYNEKLVSGKNVRLERDVSEKDEFGRLLRYVYVGSLSVNAELVKAGLARAISYLPDVKYAALFKQLETDAANSARGLWAMPQITYVFFDGLVPKVESDEYAEICNFGLSPIPLTGWKLKDREGRLFIFPDYSLGAGKKIRVYTNENHPEWGGFSFKSTTAIWNNGGDTAVLYNSQGIPVSRFRYRGT